MNYVEKSSAPVSVIIPCFCCADTIFRAVRSVAAQSLRPAEVILVEDCSGDDTLTALRNIQMSFGSDWIRIVELPANRGPSAARNAGWDAAKGDLIAFLDADDSWDWRKTQVQAALMIANPALTLTGTARTCAPTPDDVNEAAMQPVSARSLLATNRFCTSGVIVRRCLHLRFEEGKHRSEDYLLWLRIAFQEHQMMLIDAPLTIYHKPAFGKGGLSGNLWKMQLGQLDTYKQIYEEGLISRGRLLACQIWSTMRFARRLMIQAWRIVGS